MESRLDTDFGFPLRGLASGELSDSVLTEHVPPEAEPDRDRLWLHLGLFTATFFSMMFVAGWGPWGSIEGLEGVRVHGSLIAREGFYIASGWPARLHDALLYAGPFLLFLTVHEFGHYIAARRSGIRVSLPYYIPLPFALGTFGAVIRIREPIRRTRQLFDIGASGPLAGFVVALIVLLVAVLLLPPAEYLIGADITAPGAIPIHELTVAQFRATGFFPSRELVAPNGSGAMVLGDTPLFHAIASLGAYRVPGYEIVHYPVLLAGWLGLFFTALNLLPVGQLDGGHVVYALFGPAVHRIVARVTTLLLLLSGSIGWVDQMVPSLEASYGAAGLWGGWGALVLLLAVYLRRYFGRDWRGALVGVPVLLGLVAAIVQLTPGLASSVGYFGWLIWSGLILFLIQMDHPPVLVQEPLTPMRKALGWVCVVIFVLCFSIQPILIV